ncbi:hypothetical protein ACH47C_19095 [Streptomyces rishiriensis]|uniref:hypothetical protein n=1 Tax=Streptomyces rishiriensis TaxID=68264 RepID=UPI00131F14B2|nr:hypothetical protein [Streptomyces rishiriensis]
MGTTVAEWLAHWTEQALLLPGGLACGLLDGLLDALRGDLLDRPGALDAQEE